MFKNTNEWICRLATTNSIPNELDYTDCYLTDSVLALPELTPELIAAVNDFNDAYIDNLNNGIAALHINATNELHASGESIDCDITVSKIDNDKKRKTRKFASVGTTYDGSIGCGDVSSTIEYVDGTPKVTWQTNTPIGDEGTAKSAYHYYKTIIKPELAVLSD